MTAVWLDVDPGVGVPERDVDDALALLQAFHSPELDVRGVSVVFGNAPLEDGYPVAVELAERFGRTGLPVLRGAAAAEALGASCAAVDGLAAELERKPLVLLALGPLTNVATLLQRHPALAPRIDRIVCVAARRVGQRFQTAGATRDHLPFRDFNFESDPDAMRVLLDSDVRLEFAPWEVSSHVFLRRAELDALAASGPAGAWIRERSQSWLGLWEREFGVDGFNPFDTLAVGWVTHPQWIRAHDVCVWIDEGPDDTVDPAAGDPPRKPYLLVDPERAGGRRAVYCAEPQPAFKAELLARLGR